MTTINIYLVPGTNYCCNVRRNFYHVLVRTAVVYQVRMNGLCSMRSTRSMRSTLEECLHQYYLFSVQLNETHCCCCCCYTPQTKPKTCMCRTRDHQGWARTGRHLLALRPYITTRKTKKKKKKKKMRSFYGSAGGESVIVGRTELTRLSSYSFVRERRSKRHVGIESTGGRLRYFDEIRS